MKRFFAKDHYFNIKNKLLRVLQTVFLFVLIQDFISFLNLAHLVLTVFRVSFEYLGSQNERLGHFPVMMTILFNAELHIFEHMFISLIKLFTIHV